jgi:GNAT superfamily N-acetyltransferase
MDAIVLSEDLPTAAEYREFRARAGWATIDEAIVQQTIGAACYSVTLRRQGKLIGLARVMGDGALYFFLADLIVDPELRGKGLGGRLMRAVTDYFDRCASRARPSR